VILPNQDPPPLPDLEIARRIRSYIVDNFLLGEDDLASADSLLDKGIIDSTGVLEVVAFLEETFDIEVADDDMLTNNLDSVEKLARFVVTKRSTAVDVIAPESAM
jgi:acyl carrier protein